MGFALASGNQISRKEHRFGRVVKQWNCLVQDLSISSSPPLPPGEGEERQGRGGERGEGNKGKVIGGRREGQREGSKKGKVPVSVHRVSQPVMRRRQRRSGWRSGPGASWLGPRHPGPGPRKAVTRHRKSLSRSTGALTPLTDFSRLALTFPSVTIVGLVSFPLRTLFPRCGNVFPREAHRSHS